MKRPLLMVLFITVLAFVLVGCSPNQTPLQPILLQGQGRIETDVMIATLENMTEIELGGITYYKGTIDDYPVVVVDHGVGVINAASHTAAAITEFNPYCIINQGTAGGHDPELNRYDIVLGKEIVYINFIYTQQRDEGEGIEPEDWELTYYDFKLPASAAIDDDPAYGGSVELQSIPSDPTLMQISQTVSNKYIDGKVVNGIIGSGDIWNKEFDRIALIRNQFGTSSEDMETFATAMTCLYHDIPFLGVRIISNSEVAGAENSQFDPETGRSLQNYILEVTRAIIEQIEF